MSTLFFIFDAVKINWIYRVVRSLKKIYFKNDKRVAAYLVCVVIATGFWFLNALNKIYTVDIVAPVKYVNFPNNKTFSNKLPDQFDLTIKAHGFNILRQKLSFIFSPLEFNVNDLTNNRMLESRKSLFIFPTRQFQTELSYMLSNNLEILDINPDTIIFKFDKMGQKRVKVRPLVRVSLKKQFQISGDMTTVPDSVTVNGPQSVLDTIRFIYTENKRFNDVEEAIQENFELGKIKNLFYDTDKVLVKIPVEEFTEADQNVTVKLLNAPSGLKVKLFPPKVKAIFQVSLSRFAGIHPEDFKLTVDYADIQEGKPRMKIHTQSLPAFIYDFKIVPEELEYLIEND